MSRDEAPELEPEVQQQLELLRRRVPLLERAAELAGTTLAHLQLRLARLRETSSARPRSKLAQRLDRFEQDVALVRRQFERLRAAQAAGRDGGAGAA